MVEKIKKLKLVRNIEKLGDVRVLGLIGFGVIAVLVTWSGVAAIQTNYALQRQIAELQQRNDLLDLQNQNQRFKNKYLETDQFQELAARRQFGLAAPGEKVLLISKKVALAHTIDLPTTPKTDPQPAIDKAPAYQRNFRSWIDFFLHRNKENS